MEPMRSLLDNAIGNLNELLPRLAPLAQPLQTLGEAMLRCWESRGKVLACGNGGSAADAIHLAEELSVRFCKNRKALAAVALCDAGAITCAGNDFGYEQVFARQVDALGNPGDVLVAFTTSGNSPSILRAIELAKSRQVVTAGFLGKGGGKARGLCDIEIVVPAELTHRIQEAHLILYHTLCEWIDSRVD